MEASLAEHTIVESKPDTQVDDLRVARPWPELVAHAAAYDVDALDDGAHKHVPYGACVCAHAFVCFERTRLCLSLLR